ncbi:MAG TPA: hypothetical protein VEF76_04045 [Patescibacteria group bacterium]|nr:hypothetical protein [Patescibacteria group bacterium]
MGDVMQDGAISADNQQSTLPVQSSSFGKPVTPTEPAGMINPDERPEPPPPPAQNTKSKFAGDSVARQLTAQELNNALNIEQLDDSKIKIKEALIDPNRQIEIKLANGDSFHVGRDGDGYTRISVPDGQPANVETLIAMAAVAKGKGWDSISVRGGEEFSALSYHVLKDAGIKMLNPPSDEVIERYRPQYEAALQELNNPKPPAALGAQKTIEEDRPAKKAAQPKPPAPR